MSVADHLSSTFAVKPRLGVIFLLILASLALTYIPIVNLLIAPIGTFVTAVHEMGHALACILTGGHVSSLTIVSDGEGHGGLTYCQGGIPFIYSQAGYLGTTVFGCMLIALGRVPRISKVVLSLIGATIGVASLTLMLGGVLHGSFFQGLLSTFWGLLLAGFFIYAGAKLNFYWANLLLLFLGVQTGLNALNDIVIVTQSTLGFFPGTWSDASNMANMTGIPALFWALLWGLVSIGLLGGTLWWTYKSERK